MSVTAAEGLRRLGRRSAAIRRREEGSSRSSARLEPRGRRGDVHAATASRLPACRSNREHLAARRAAGGRHQLRHRQRGDRARRASSTHARPPRARRGCSGSTPEEVLVLSTGVIGDAAADATALLPGVDQAVAALVGRRRRRRGRGDHDDRHARRRSGRRVRRLHRRRHGEGLGDDPPRPRDDARGRHDRLPARSPARRSTSCGRRSTRRFNAITVDGELLHERRGDPARERRKRHRADAGERRVVRALRCAKVCATSSRQIVADGEGATVLAEINVTRRRRRRAGEGDRAAHRDLAAREDRALRPRRELGPRADGRGQRAVQRRLRATSTPSRSTLRYNGTLVLDHGAPTDVEPDVSGPSCTIELDLGLGDGTRRLPDERPLLRLRPHQRGLPLMSRLVVKVGGAVAARVGESHARPREEGHEVCVVHGAGPQITAGDGRAAASPSSSSTAGA